MENNIVKVSLWGQTVGEIYWDEKRNQSCFLANSFGLVSKEKLAEKYFQNEININM